MHAHTYFKMLIKVIDHKFEQCLNETANLNISRGRELKFDAHNIQKTPKVKGINVCGLLLPYSLRNNISFLITFPKLNITFMKQ